MFEYPTAHTSFEAKAATAVNTVPLVPTLGLGTTLQVEPFQCQSAPISPAMRAANLDPVEAISYD